jgi:O-antigen/teichoic acid export membrane protein
MGFYGQAWANANRSLVVMDIVGPVAFPHLARAGERHEIRRLLAHYLSLVLGLAGAWLTFIFILAPTFVEEIYGAKWLPTVLPLRVLALAAPAFMVGWLVYQAFAVEDRAGRTARIGVVQFVAQLGLGVPAAASWGTAGYAAVIAAVAWSSATYAAATLGGFWNSYRAVVVRALVATALGILGGEALLALGDGPVEHIVAGVTGLLVYLAASAFLSTPGERSAVLSLVRRPVRRAPGELEQSAG